MTNSLFDFSHAQFNYAPYPIAYIPQFIRPEDYRAIVSHYPPADLFKYMPHLGKKYSLSEVNNREQYFAFIKQNTIWKDMLLYIKSREFVQQVFTVLSDANIDLGFFTRSRVTNSVNGSAVYRARQLLECFRSLNRRTIGIKTRFEFSMLPADGGHIRPHTDAANKIITLVVSCNGPGEWSEQYGGGTSVLAPKQDRQLFNHVNRYLEFDDTRELKTFPYTANQCVMFVKTFNSLHAVHPMRGPSAGPMRKTLTINIEAL